MDPILAAILLSGGTQLLSGVLGAREQSKSRKQLGEQYETSREDTLAQNQQLKELADRIYAMQTAPITLPSGDVVSYDPETGFTSTLSPESQKLQDLISGRQQYDLTTGEGIRREDIQRGFKGRQRAGNLADIVAGKFRDVPDVDPNIIRSELALENLAATQSPGDTSEAFRSVARGGGDYSNLARALSERDRGNVAARTAGTYLPSREAAESLSTGKRINLANLLSSFQGAEQGAYTPPTPTSPEDVLTQLVARQQAVAPQVGGTTANLYRSQTQPQMQPIQPNFALPQAISAGGQFGSGLIEYLASRNKPSAQFTAGSPVTQTQKPLIPNSTYREGDTSFGRYFNP